MRASSSLAGGEIARRVIGSLRFLLAPSLVALSVGRALRQFDRPGGSPILRIDEWTRQEKYFRYEIIFLCLLSIIIYTEYVEKYHEMRVLYGQKLEADQRKTEQLMSVPDHAAEARRMAPAMRPKNDSSDAIVGLLITGAAPHGKPWQSERQTERPSERPPGAA